MNIQEYISSGIIESYVLGLATNLERLEFERMCALHPELVRAREAFEITLEEYAMLNQTQPSKNLKSKIFAAIDIESDQEHFSTEAGRADELVMNDPPDTVFKRPPGVVSMGRTRFLAAASLILLLCSIALNFYYFRKYMDYNTRYQALVQSQSELADNNQVLQAKMAEYENTLNLMKDPRMLVVKMPSIPKGPDSASMTTVYWDSLSKDVYLSVIHLPDPSETQQYQLWALLDGKPIDAGVIELKKGVAMVKMKNIPKADAFAITLEKKGGSPSPNLKQLYVMGKV